MRRALRALAEDGGEVTGPKAEAGGQWLEGKQGQRKGLGRGAQSLNVEQW